MYVRPDMVTFVPVREAAVTEMLPAGHWLHQREPLADAFQPTLHGVHRRPSRLAVPGAQATQVPAVAKVSEDSSR